MKPRQHIFVFPSVTSPFILGPNSDQVHSASGPSGASSLFEKLEVLERSGIYRLKADKSLL